MSLEDDLSRQLSAKAANVRVTPDFGELAGRIRSADRRAARRDRLALGAAVVVLAASLGGLAGAFASTPRANPSNSKSARFLANGNGPTTSLPSTASHGGSTGPPASSLRTVIDRQLGGGLTIDATVQQFASPVVISGEWSSITRCATGEIVTTTVGQSGSFGGGISVANLPKLDPDGLEILSSGILQVSGAGQVWWVATAVGSGVTRVAAESVGGSPVTSVPSDGISVIAGPVSNLSSDEMSAVAESTGGDESLAFSLGSGPDAVGTVAAGSDASGCSALKLPSQPSSAAASQPAEPGLAAGSIIAAFEQADSANPLLGFAANLAAVNDGGRLSAATTTPNGPAAKPRAEVPVSGSGIVDVQQVSFLSDSAADVVYRVNGGVLLTGEAQLGTSGIWRVSVSTFCSNLASGIVRGDVPPAVVSDCDELG